MQDIQNIPNPDVNSIERDDDFGSHSDVEQNPSNDNTEGEDETVPVPPDRQPSEPIEEPPVSEDEDESERIV
jgi:hypothetical protein